MRVTLSKDSWHCRLQRFVLGECQRPEEFLNLCPYFWLTVFCLLWSPLVALWRSGAWVITGAVDVIGGPLERYIFNPLDAYFLDHVRPLTEEEVAKMFKREYFRYGKARSWALRKWASLQGANWVDIGFQLLERDEMRRAAERIRRLEQDEVTRRIRQAKLMRIAALTEKFAPLIVLVVVVPILGGIGYGGYKLIQWLNTFDVEYWKIFKAILVVLTALVIGISIAIYMSMGKAKTVFDFVTSPFRTKVGRAIISPIRSLGRRLWTGIKSGAELFVQYIKATKEGYCPKIEWEEKK